MLGDRFTHSNAPVRRIKAVQFGVLDPDFIVRSTLHTFRDGLVILLFDFGSSKTIPISVEKSRAHVLLIPILT